MVVVLLVVGCGSNSAPSRPNIVLIVADDLGYTDLGAYGGEIFTPNIDKLASRGVQFTQFYVAPTCSPTRASLLSGVDPHAAGLGQMAEFPLAPNQQGQPGYKGHLSRHISTFAELLRQSGYQTYMVGKWHVGDEPDLIPTARGFERSFSLLDGGAQHFDAGGVSPTSGAAQYVFDGKPTELPENFYTTRAFTDHVINFIREQNEINRPWTSFGSPSAFWSILKRPVTPPFFAYVAYTSPHWPLQAPAEYLDRYEGQYADGYDELRKTRVERLKVLGLIGEDTGIAPHMPPVPAWSMLSDDERKISARKMEIYAAMVENLDHNVGRLIDFLEASDLTSNTVVVFMSDNGAAAEDPSQMFFAKKWIAKTFDNSFDQMGKQGSFVSYGAGWSHASVGPFRGSKGSVSEGGVLAPLIVAAPKSMGIRSRSEAALTAVVDLAPTFLEWAGADQPAQVGNSGVRGLQGRSLIQLLKAKVTQVRGAETSFGFELQGRRALRQGDWKILWQAPPLGSGRWQLYQLSRDPIEQNDLADVHPEILKRLIGEWERYTEHNGVVLPSRVTPFTGT